MFYENKCELFDRQIEELVSDLFGLDRNDVNLIREFSEN